MAEPAALLRDLVAATKPRRGDGAASTVPSSAPWTRAALCGRLVEVSGRSGASASLTLVFALVLDAQRHGETAAWVCARESTFFPPDAAQGGVDLDALPVVRVPGVEHVPRAAERLLRSGAFGLVVLDLAACRRSRSMPGAGAAEYRPPDVSLPLQARLLGLAERHDAAVVFLTRKPRTAPSLSSLVSLRVETRRADRLCELVALKDKRRAPGWTYEELCRVPDATR